ncbi:hypothetical protein KCP77_19705 [Salmonella enterica subsp. enterica]|nr:hypothetical protein KCP77_19705 [Salmonella enterica subsp. enterica]
MSNPDGETVRRGRSVRAGSEIHLELNPIMCWSALPIPRMKRSLKSGSSCCWIRRCSAERGTLEDPEPVYPPYAGTSCCVLITLI